MEYHSKVKEKTVGIDRRNGYGIQNERQMEVYFSLLFNLVFLFNYVLCGYFCAT